MKHYLASIPLMCLVLLLSVGNSETYAQQSTKETKAKMLQTAAPSKMQTHKAGKKLSIEEIKALKAKQLEERNAKRKLRATSKKQVATSVKTSNGKAEMISFNNKALTSKKLLKKNKQLSANAISLRERAQEMNQKYAKQGFKAVITNVGGKEFIELKELPQQYGMAPERAKK